MAVEQTLLQEVEDSQKYISRDKEGESPYRRDLKMRIELINGVLDNMKNPDVQICEVMETTIE
jgi:hypothetical protein